MVKTEPIAGHWIDLFACVRALGFSLGFRYWRISRAARKTPSLVIHWAEKCEKEANDCNLRGDPHGEIMMNAWAIELRASAKARFGAKNQRRSLTPNVTPPAGLPGGVLPTP